MKQLIWWERRPSWAYVWVGGWRTLAYTITQGLKRVVCKSFGLNMQDVVFKMDGKLLQEYSFWQLPKCHLLPANSANILEAGSNIEVKEMKIPSATSESSQIHIPLCKNCVAGKKSVCISIPPILTCTYCLGKRLTDCCLGISTHSAQIVQFTFH